MVSKASIILPYYNRVELVGRALSSIQKQDLRGIAVEVLLIDDGSQGSVPDDALRGNGLDIQHVQCESNSGVGHARHLGIEKASGDVIFFIDSDDYWLPDHMSKTLACFETHNAVCSAYLVFDGKKMRVRGSRKPFLLSHDFTYKNPVGFSTFAVKAKIAKKLGFPKIRMRNDFIFLKHIAYENRILYRPEPTVIYDSESGMSVRKTKLLKFQWATYRNYFNQGPVFAGFNIIRWGLYHTVLGRLKYGRL